VPAYNTLNNGAPFFDKELLWSLNAAAHEEMSCYELAAALRCWARRYRQPYNDRATNNFYG